MRKYRALAVAIHLPATNFTINSMPESSCGKPVANPNIQEWVKPGSDWDKLRQKQDRRRARNAEKQRAAQIAKWERKKWEQHQAKIQAAKNMQQQEAFAQMLDDATEELAIEDARDEIRRGL